MGEVVALIRVMPSNVLNDEQMEQLKEEVKKRIKEPAKLTRIDIRDIAFGLRALDVTVVVPDKEGGVDPVAEEISCIDGVASAEVIDLGRI
ncbi:MAG: elongation factor 1-beta [Thermoplasmata archaeon]|nr:MAG: elongation factor 1-beta [Thermoplasmata archaeon]